jgi:hypothetical protein
MKCSLSGGARDFASNIFKNIPDISSAGYKMKLIGCENDNDHKYSSNLNPKHKFEYDLVGI